MMIVQYQRRREYQDIIREVSESAMSQLKTSFAHRGVQYIVQYIIDYFFTAKEVSTDNLKSEVDKFYLRQQWYSLIALKLKLKEVPRDKAFEQELSERLEFTS